VKIQAYLLTLAPNHPRFGEFLAALNLARQGGDRIYLYALDDGVCAFQSEEFWAQMGKDARVMGCAYAAQKRNLSYVDRVTYGGLGLLANLIARAEVFDAY
jgi:hypothetical protein